MSKEISGLKPTIRQSRNVEVYELVCFRCRSKVEFPCGEPHKCTRCGVQFVIQWRALGAGRLACHMAP
jgi:rRNA maturation endonuclease Nob1